MIPAVTCLIFSRRSGARPQRRLRHRVAACIVVLAALFGPAALQQSSRVATAGRDWIEHEFWIELQPVGQPAEEGYPLAPEEAAQRVLDEARYVYSAMVFGMEFRYTPLDLARQIDERFELTPVAELPWGDPGIRVRSSRQADARLWARIRYTLRDHERRRLDAWSSSRYPVASGRGEATLLGGWTAKREAIENGLKQAVREYVRARVYNKPREIRGRLAFYDPPRIILHSGSYVAQVRARLDIEMVEPYAVY